MRLLHLSFRGLDHVLRLVAATTRRRHVQDIKHYGLSAAGLGRMRVIGKRVIGNCLFFSYCRFGVSFDVGDCGMMTPYLGSMGLLFLAFKI